MMMPSQNEHTELNGAEAAQPPRFERPAGLGLLLEPGQLDKLLEREMARCRQSGGRLALLLVDAERGAETLEAGPWLWERAAQRLVQGVRATDGVYRLGAGQFAVLLHGAGLTEALRVRERLTHALAGPYSLAGRNLALRPRLAAAASGVDGDGGQVLVERARQRLHADLT